MKINLLIDSGEFWNSLEIDIVAAKYSIFIQTFSFEGDRVGTKLSDVLLSAKAFDKRLLIDSYTQYVLSDKFLYTPANLLDKALQREASETKRLIALLSENGISVKFTNPVGLLLINFARRNHKKLVVIDDSIVYIGGINFSEHNFAWHDMMLRIESSEIAKFLKEDFLVTWNEHPLAHSKDFGDIRIDLLNGRSNTIVFSEIFDVMESATRRIFVETPYFTSPFVEKLREIRRRGVYIQIVVPEANNWMLMSTYHQWEARRSDFDLRLYPDRLTHLKAMLIDDDVLIVGSINFDSLSYHSQEEIIARITDREVISQFKERVIQPDLKHSRRCAERIHDFSGYLSAVIVKTSLRLYHLLPGFLPHSVETSDKNFLHKS